MSFWSRDMNKKTCHIALELLSDSKDHGIEVNYPGPALMVLYRR